MIRTRHRLAEIRNRPLEALAAALGYRRDPADRKRWKRPGSVISINGRQFFDHLAGTGGGGAIDLVLHAKGCSFRDAVLFLDGPPAFEPPARHDPNWPHVRRWLCTRRALDPGLVDRCHRDGLLHADRRRNAVFICHGGTRVPTGAEIVGTGNRPWRGMAAGSRKAAGSFRFPQSRNPPETLVITESAIDALSAWLITSPHRTPAVFLSTNGATPNLPDWTRAWNPKRILCAYDADTEGDRAARALMRKDPRVARLRPIGRKDWNDLLKQQHDTPDGALPGQSADRPPP